MLIRDAVPADVPAMVAMGQLFRSSTRYHQHFADNPERMATMLMQFLCRPDAGIYVAAQEGGGLIGGIVLLVAPHLWSGEVMATEVVWWMNPSARGGGVRLLRVAEAWARAHGAMALQIGAPMPADPPAYERLGYVETERLFQKDLR